ncbi:MAG: SIS domain-containing protein [Alphaproteobacteria bacterium]
MQANAPHVLVAEMLETPGILRNFDETATAGWAKAITGKLMVTGEGSSRIFPAKNLIAEALRRGHPWHICTEGARQAAEYVLKNFTVIGTSNSGKTKELVELFQMLPSPRRSVIATKGSKMAALSDDCHILKCGVEKAVPATKSVVEQALVFQSLLQGPEWKKKTQAADYCAEVLAQDIPAEMAEAMAKAPTIYFAGRNNGVAEELTLKANEIARKRAVYLEGTYALHGVEEVMQEGDVLVVIEPFSEDMQSYQEKLQQGAGVKIIAIAADETPFPTITIPELGGFNGYLQLMAGWNLLAATGIAAGVNIDQPARARKVGNSI